MFSGLFAASATNACRCFSISSAGTSSRVANFGFAPRMCTAMSLATCLNSSLRATKSVSHFSSTIAACLPSWWT